MRQGNQFTAEQSDHLISPVIKEEISKALKCISDLTVPGINGYGAMFFKATWDVTKNDIIHAVMESFEKERIYSTINNTIITLNPKSTTTNMVKDY